MKSICIVVDDKTSEQPIACTEKGDGSTVPARCCCNWLTRSHLTSAFIYSSDVHLTQSMLQGGGRSIKFARVVLTNDSHTKATAVLTDDAIITVHSSFLPDSLWQNTSACLLVKCKMINSFLPWYSRR